MASELDQKSLEQAFQGRADIQAAIRAAAGITPSLVLNTFCCCFSDSLYFTTAICIS
jgi:hypothetical protein